MANKLSYEYFLIYQYRYQKSVMLSLSLIFGIEFNIHVLPFWVLLPLTAFGKMIAILNSWLKFDKMYVLSKLPNYEKKLWAKLWNYCMKMSKSYGVRWILNRWWLILLFFPHISWHIHEFRFFFLVSVEWIHIELSYYNVWFFCIILPPFFFHCNNEIFRLFTHHPLTIYYDFYLK